MNRRTDDHAFILHRCPVEPVGKKPAEAGSELTAKRPSVESGIRHQRTENSLLPFGRGRCRLVPELAQKFPIP